MICTYKSNTQGNPRVFNGVAIKGVPQDTDPTTHLHAATMADLAAQWVIDPATAGGRVYMNTSLDSVLRDIGVAVKVPMTGTGQPGANRDIIRVRTNGTIDVIEVRSTGQPQSDIDDRIVNIKQYLLQNCPDRLGNVIPEQPLTTPADLLGVQLPS